MDDATPQPTRPHRAQHHHAALRVEYDGTPYHGWTRQPRLRTLQSDLAAAFEAVHCTDLHMRCAGRTDAGVHATAQVVDAHYQGSVAPERLAVALAAHLPDELAVTHGEVAPVGFDARADATSRAYEYRVLTRQIDSPTRARLVHHHPRPLDRDALHEAAAAVLGTHRFSAFTPSRTAHVFFDRTIVESLWEERGDELVYRIRANAFLRHMVRITVGTMLEIARGERPMSDLHEMLDGAPRASAGATALPTGLCLVDVTWMPVAGLPLPPGWRAGRPVEHQDPAVGGVGVVPFSSAG